LQKNIYCWLAAKMALLHNIFNRCTHRVTIVALNF